MGIISVNYYIEVVYNNKVILTTPLFDNEEKAIKWWEVFCSVYENTKAYLVKEIFNHTNSEYIIQLEHIIQKILM